MGIRAPLVISLLIILGMLAVSAWAWPSIPGGARIATHWDINNVPNGYMPKHMALFVTPATTALITLIFAVAPSLVRRKEVLVHSAKAYVAAWIGGLLVCFVAHVLLVLYARGYRIDIVGNTTFLLAVTFMFVGNLLSKTRPNPLVGVRTPWTRKSNYSWDKTHRFAGRAMVGGSLAALATMAVAGPQIANVVLIGGMIGMAIISIPLSYYYWRHDPHRTP